jgi:hypothetical protein
MEGHWDGPEMNRATRKATPESDVSEGLRARGPSGTVENPVHSIVTISICSAHERLFFWLSKGQWQSLAFGCLPSFPTDRFSAYRASFHAWLF